MISLYMCLSRPVLKPIAVIESFIDIFALIFQWGILSVFKVFKLTEISKVFMNRVYTLASHNHSTTATPVLWKKTKTMVMLWWLFSQEHLWFLNFLFYFSNHYSFKFFRPLIEYLLVPQFASIILRPYWILNCRITRLSFFCKYSIFGLLLVQNFPWIQ